MSGACLLGSSSIPDLGGTTTLNGDDGGSSGGDGSGYVPPPQCTVDGECGGQQGCRGYSCVGGKCVENDPPANTPAVPQPQVACKRAVCDGHGNVSLLVDPSVPGPDAPHDCMKPSCAADGTPTLLPDPADIPVDVAGDCQKPACAVDGTMTSSPDPADVPPDQPGDCQRNSCTASGAPTTVPDDTDPPKPGPCDTYTCSAGAPVATPANVGKVCASTGFACDTQGQCDVCPAVDAACTDPGPGATAHSPQTAVDYQGIGHCDSGGRSWCGALSASETSWFTYYDDGTGPFCTFDPMWEVKPTAPATMCVYFECSTPPSCPVGALAATSTTGHAGCCIAAAPGTFTSMAMGFCGGGRVEITVEGATSACTGYELDFHD
jgi:hypothetical protein